MAASVEELAFDVSLDSLYAQRNVLDDVRSRATTLLTASSIVTSFVGGRAIDTVGLDAVTGDLPRLYQRRGAAVHRGSQLYSDAAHADASLDEVYLALAAEIQVVRQENRPLVDRTLWFLRVGFASLILEVILFLAALAVH